MSEMSRGLGDRLQLLVASEEPSANLRRDIERQLRRPLPRRNPAPRVLALASVVGALVVGTVALAGGLGSSGSGQQVSAVAPAAPALPAAADLPHGRSATRVLAADATRTPDTAQAALRRLQAAGYISAGVLDNPAPATMSRVFYAPGYEAEARDVARVLGLDESAVNRTPPAVPEPNGAEVLVVVGTDLVGLALSSVGG